MKRRIHTTFERWRQEPPEVRLRIATLLTAGCGAVLVVVWLFILLPLQLRLSAPDQGVAGVVSGLRDVVATPTPSPSPSPTPDVQYYHETRPSFQGNDSGGL